MKTIRHNVFETNSSSSHSVTIATGFKGETPLKEKHKGGPITLTRGEFGWEWQDFTDFESKLKYAYTLAAGQGPWSKSEPDKLSKAGNREIQTLEKILKRYLGVTKVIMMNNWGYVDHQSEADSKTDIYQSEETLINFLFNDESEFRTGNDNEDPYGYDDEDW